MRGGLYLGFLVGHIFVYNGWAHWPIDFVVDSKQIRSRDSQQELVNMLENSYRLRGRRGGVKTKLDEARKRHNIPVHYTSCTNRFKFEYSNSNIKGVNFSNLIKIPISKDNNNQTVPHFVPRVMLSNVMSLTPKLDEVSEFLLRKKIDIGFITETWLKDRVLTL